jgi:hypothetical protein
VTPAEQSAQRADAERRVQECRSVLRRLWPDRDDAMVLSEIVAVVTELRKAEAVLR